MTAPDDPRAIAGKLTEPMREALDRLARRMVWIDGRSRNALVRRRLATVHGEVRDDAMLGSFTIVTISPLGLQVRDILQEEASR